MVSRRGAIAWISAAIGLFRSASVSNAQPGNGFPRRPPFGEGEETALASSRLWLKESTERDVVAFALGEERRFSVDQTNRLLSLTYADGESLIVDVEALGSFNPRDRTFRWAWSNTSIDPQFARASEDARAHLDVRDFRSFSAPIFEATFDECESLVAHAAKLSGCAGVYRAITEDHVSVFLGYRRPSDADTTRIWHLGRTSERDVSEALSVIIAYDEAMLPFDIEYEKQAGTGEVAAAPAESREHVLSEIAVRQRLAHRRFWRRDDDYWDPPLSWPSPHDPQTRSFLLAAPRRAGGVYVIRSSGAHHRDAFVLQRFPDGMRIVDLDLDWGAWLLLP